MKTSVLIPAFNEEKYLPATLESIRAMTTQPDEIIVIDAQSTDKTADIAKKYNAKVLSVPHRGIGFARQKGVEAAMGDIIAFTDADSIVPKFWLAEIIKTLSRDGVSGVYGSYRVPDGWLPYRLFINLVQPPMTYIFDFFGLPISPGQNTAFWKEKALAAGGYPIDFKLAEDLEMGRRLRTVGKFVYRPDLNVSSSGRRGNEGIQLIPRMSRALWLYYTARRADVVGFPDIR